MCLKSTNNYKFKRLFKIKPNLAIIDKQENGTNLVEIINPSTLMKKVINLNTDGG